MVTAIGSSQIQDMLKQIRSVVDQSKPSNLAAPSAPLSPSSSVNSTQSGFAEALKAQLGEVNRLEQSSTELGKKFVLGDSNVNLSDVMVSGQKANIALQTTVQVRNKVVNAYQTIMNMQI